MVEVNLWCKMWGFNAGTFFSFMVLLFCGLTTRKQETESHERSGNEDSGDVSEEEEEEEVVNVVHHCQTIQYIVLQLHLVIFCSHLNFCVLSPRRRLRPTARSPRRPRSSTAAVAENTRGKNTSIAANTRNTSTPRRRTRSAAGCPEDRQHTHNNDDNQQRHLRTRATYDFFENRWQVQFISAHRCSMHDVVERCTRSHF